MKRCCAILATYNEADIIKESVQKLLDGGVDVFIIDNGSNDETFDKVGPMVGRGVVDIRTVRFQEGEREIYDWTSILRLKESLSRELGYDWYLHVDADEIRYSPWPHLSLREGLDRVDQSGYNLVNFKLFNFRLSHDIAASSDYERDMPNYSDGEDFNHRQIKAWKAHPEIDLVSHGGHMVNRPDGKIFPIRFIHKHYPVRGLEHGYRKIFKERKDRFSIAEKQRGWHVQYDHMDAFKPEDVFWQADRLVPFEMQSECLSLLEEGCDIASRMLALIDQPTLLNGLDMHILKKYTAESFPQAEIFNLFSSTEKILAILMSNMQLNLTANPKEIDFINHVGYLLAAIPYLQGDPRKYSRLKGVRFG